MAKFSDVYSIPVHCYGLRTDFQGNTFPGSNTLLGIADHLIIVPTICYCGKNATMCVRVNNGSVVKDGEQIYIGGNIEYETYCRKHWYERVNCNTESEKVATREQLVREEMKIALEQGEMYNI